MLALPDIVVGYNSLVTKPSGSEFHWTLTATHSGPGGTGNKAKVIGYELWQMGNNNRILKLQGHFPTEEYNRQMGTEIENYKLPLINGTLSSVLAGGLNYINTRTNYCDSTLLNILYNNACTSAKLTSSVVFFTLAF